MLTILMLLTLKTNFNLTGYNYYLDEESMMLTIEERFVKKEMYNVQDTPIQALKVMLPINQANEIWNFNVYILSLFISVLFVLFYKPLRPRKNVKLYVGLYVLFLITFIIWDIYIHTEMIEEISNALNNL